MEQTTEDIDDEKIRNKPIRIVNVEFEGVKRTRPTVLAKIVADVFASESVGDCMRRSHQVGRKLGSLFTSVGIKIEPVESGVGSDNSNKDKEKAEEPIDHVITFVVNERGRATLRSTIQADNNSATHLNFELSAPNLNGVGDSLSFGIKSNSLSKSIPAPDFEYRLPLIPWRTLFNPIYSILFSRYTYESLPSGFDQENKSVTNQVEFYSHPHLKHSFGFINTWTHIKSSSIKTPIEIREQSGHYLKSYLRYGVTVDTREGGNFPYEGILAKLSNDITTNLFKKGAKFARQDAQIQFNKLLLPRYGLLGQVNIFAGTLINASKIDISDRFFPGGVPSFRGFEWKGFGANVRKHPTGVTSYLTAGLHLYPTLPATSPDSWINEFIRPQIFINVGTTGDLSGTRRLISRNDLKREALLLRDSLRYSCGFGLVACIGSVRLELNYCVPIVTREGDSVVSGLQFGFYSSI